MNARLVAHYQALSSSGETHEQRLDAEVADRWRPRSRGRRLQLTRWKFHNVVGFRSLFSVGCWPRGWIVYSELRLVCVSQRVWRLESRRNFLSNFVEIFGLKKFLLRKGRFFAFFVHLNFWSPNFFLIFMINLLNLNWWKIFILNSISIKMITIFPELIPYK